MTEYGHDQERVFIQNKIKPSRSFAELTFSAKDVRKIMSKNKMSQSDLAKLLGVSQVAVSRWSRGKLKPSAFNVMMLRELEEGTLGYPLMHPDDVREILYEVGWTHHSEEVNVKKVIESYAISYLRLLRLGMTGKSE